MSRIGVSSSTTLAPCRPTRPPVRSSSAPCAPTRANSSSRPPCTLRYRQSTASRFSRNPRSSCCSSPPTRWHLSTSTRSRASSTSTRPKSSTAPSLCRSSPLRTHSRFSPPTRFSCARISSTPTSRFTTPRRTPRIISCTTGKWSPAHRSCPLSCSPRTPRPTSTRSPRP